MIDLSKKYRTRRGGEVFGLCERNGLIYGWEWRGLSSGPQIWNSDGSLCGHRQSVEDLIEVRKLRQWVLTETGEEARYRNASEWALDLFDRPFCSQYGPTIGKFRPLSVELREIEEPRGNG